MTELTKVFGPIERKMKAHGCSEQCISNFKNSVSKLLRGDTGLICSSQIAPVENIPGIPENGEYQREALAALPKTVVVKLNGGLGTSMGLDRAKSMLPVRDGLSFFDVFARQVLRLRSEHSVSVPLLLMNSFRTEADAVECLESYPEISRGQQAIPTNFVQNQVPKLTVEELVPVQWPLDPAQEWCPPGHGDLYVSLLSSGILADLIAKGYEYAFVSNSDNLGATLHLPLLGYFAKEQFPFLMEVTRRTEMDSKGGHLARRFDGGLTLREVAQCPAEELDSFQDISVYKFFNTNSLWLHLPRLQELLESKSGVIDLPLIRNTKPVDPKDPNSPAVFQLETAMGAAISVFDEASAVLVPRARFRPVKTTNDLLLLCSDLFTVTPEHEICALNSEAANRIAIDLDRKFYGLYQNFLERFPFGVPSLQDCCSLRVVGDVRFGANVKLRGQVVIENPGENQIFIPDNSLVEG